MDRAAASKDPTISNLPTEALLDPLHADPRWLPFLRKIGFAPEQLAKIEFKVTLPKEWQAEANATTGQASTADASQTSPVAAKP
jgi:hypothetical protein